MSATAAATRVFRNLGGVSEPGALTVVGGGLPEIRPLSGSLGPYTLSCQLAAGGMGAVYVATRDHGGGVQRTVALKTMHPHLADDPRFVRMFLSEMRVVSRINHSYVCRLLDAGCASLSISSADDTSTRANVPFVAMEYLIGEPLSRLLPLLARLPSEQNIMCVVKMIIQLCEGLHAAHEATDEDERPLNVVHRDISPDNLFQLYDGTVRVVDFGVSRVDGVMTSRAGPKGKFAYMSPEQLRCEPLDRRSDVWSMGVVLWELLAATPLMPRESDMLTTRAVLDGVLRRPSELNTYVPRWLDEIVMKALARDRRERFASALDLASALEESSMRHGSVVSAAMLGRWLEGIFPGGKGFRQDVVRHSRAGLASARPGLEVAQPRTSAPLPADPGRARRSIGRTSITAALLLAALAGFYTTGGELVGQTRFGGLTQGAARERPAGRLQLEPLKFEPTVPASTPGAALTASAQVAPPAHAPLAAGPEQIAAQPALAAQPTSAPSRRSPGSATQPARGKRPVAQRDAPTAAAMPTSPPAQASAESGQVYVSTPGAHVRVELDGQPAGQTPTRLRMPPGEHMLRLLRARGGALPVPVTVAPGQLVFVEVPLDDE
jgi:hypothetical protein